MSRPNETKRAIGGRAVKGVPRFVARPLVLPVPPSVNTYWRLWRGRVVKTDEAKRYQVTVRRLAQAARLRPLAGEVWVTLRVFRKARRGDLDGYLKLLFDALQGAAYENDAQIAKLTATREEDRDNPRVEVMVQPLEEVTPW